MAEAAVCVVLIAAEVSQEGLGEQDRAWSAFIGDGAVTQVTETAFMQGALQDPLLEQQTTLEASKNVAIWYWFPHCPNY